MMKKNLFFLLSFLLMIVSAGCSNDDSIDDSVDLTQCYTIHINGIDENGIVSGSVINKPEESNFIGDCVILFDKSDLLSKTVDSGDEIYVKILSFKEVPVVGPSTYETHFYRCKVHYVNRVEL